MVMLSALQSPEVESTAWLDPFVADFRCTFTFGSLCQIQSHYLSRSHFISWVDSCHCAKMLNSCLYYALLQH